MLLPLAIGIVAGSAVGMGWWTVFRPTMVGLGRRLIRPSVRNPRSRWIKGTQFVLSGQLPLAIWIALLLPGPLTHLVLSMFLPFWAAILGGLLATGGFLVELINGAKNLHAIERTLLPAAVDNLLSHASVDFTTRMLEYTLHSPDPVFRLAAVKGLTALGTAQALKLLAKANNDPDYEVRTASERGAESIRRALGEGKPLSVAAMAAMVTEHGFLSKKMDALSGSDFKLAARKLIELEQSMTEIANSQMALRAAFPELFCRKCQTRPSEARYSRWRYVYCRKCGDVADMKLNVRRVFGAIGPYQMPTDKRDITVALWDEPTHQAHFAEIDALSICDDGKINLDWAINAVTDKFAEQWKDRNHPIEITVAPNTKLSANAVHLLQTLNSQFQWPQV